MPTTDTVVEIISIKIYRIKNCENAFIFATEQRFTNI